MIRMHAWWRAIGPVVLMNLACTLPIEDKAACEDSVDCVEGRACVDGVCTDDACGYACGALCEARDECESDRSCPETCDASMTALAVLQPAECGVQYDQLAEGACENLACFDGCVASCTQGVECALLEEGLLSRCSLQCQLDPGACPPAPDTCAAVDVSALRCWSRGQSSPC